MDAFLSSTSGVFEKCFRSLSASEPSQVQKLCLYLSLVISGWTDSTNDLVSDNDLSGERVRDLSPELDIFLALDLVKEIQFCKMNRIVLDSM